MNLLTNAAKFTEQGGHVWVAVEREADEIVLRVRDSGIGISSDMLPRIFDLFVQADRRLERSHGGLGIGLTMVRKLVELHGGRVCAHSTGVGNGSEFVVRLPAVSEPPAAEREPTVQTSASGVPPARRILVVDDNQDAANSLGMLLRLTGQEVQVAHDGLGALQAVRAFRPDVVFLDLGMPGMDGYEVARRLRDAPEVKGVVLVALTGWGQDEDRLRSQEAGFDHHLVKPIEPEALCALLADPKVMAR